MYLDPNFGSMIVQLIIAAIAGVGAYFILMRNKVSSIFKGKDSQDSDQE